MFDISYVTSCYNSQQFLDSLIQNLRKQSASNYEHVIVDSNSTDDSVEIIKWWANQDQRIHLVQQPERTPYGVSWLVGWRAASAPIIGNANTDDGFFPYATNQFVHHANKSSSDIAVWYGGYETRKGETVTARGIPQDFDLLDWQQFFRGGPRFCWRADLQVNWEMLFKAAAKYDSAWDYYMCLYFLSLGYSFYRIPSILSIYNQRGDSIENSNKLKNTFQSLRAIETFFPNSPAIVHLHYKTRVESPEFYSQYLQFVKEF